MKKKNCTYYIYKSVIRIRQEECSRFCIICGERRLLVSFGTEFGVF